MAEKKAKKNESTETTVQEPKASGADEVAERVAVEQEQGFSGVEVDPIPNEEYSLQSGPDSPSPTRAEQLAAADKAAEVAAGKD